MFLGFPSGDSHVTRDLRDDPEGTPYDGLYGEAPPKRGTFFRLQVYERVGILIVDVWVCERSERAQTDQQMNFMGL